MTKDVAIFNYGFDISIFNQFIDYRVVSLGPILTATLNIGNYTLTGLLAEITRAMQAVDINNTYTWSVDRTVDAGRGNRVRVQTSGSYLDVLLGTGPNAGNSPAPLIGFPATDQTGGTNYSGSGNAGTILVPDMPTYDYLAPDEFATNDGVKNVSSSGIKETLVFAQMYFAQGQWKYITNEFGNTQKDQWNTFLRYATRQNKFEFSPSIEEDTSLVYQVTMEKTPADGKDALAYTLQQMLGEGLYRYYDTGKMTMRLLPGTFIP